jgi:cation-transporting ATPase 13A2
MLTGESTPIIKIHLPNINKPFDAKIDSKYIMYAGTKIVQKRGLGNAKVMGLVYSTGFNTVKGNLIRSILYPKEVEIKFKKDSVKYIFFMGLVSILGFLISVPFMIKNGIEVSVITTRCLDLITTTVPPSLPACIGIGISYALSRLRKWGIICINRDRVNISGRINMVCFDKTGTLTEDHLDVYGFRPSKFDKQTFWFDSFISNCKDLQNSSYNYYKQIKENPDKDLNKNKDINKLFIECLASCHGITRVDGKIIGDPIDVKMFEASGWELKENLENQENYDSLVFYTYYITKNFTHIITLYFYLFRFLLMLNLHKKRNWKKN